MEVVITVIIPAGDPQDAADKLMLFEASPENIELGVNVRRIEIKDDGRVAVLRGSLKDNGTLNNGINRLDMF